ncbi:Lrp/AsnC family transcriptional regulator [Hoeflea prorocentri]|uniref:Lrp/AsnC family transcriptional regulator n=1 Tax=Hoeflea prorocentri TaxID=1922333 RepID=A0A9X3ZGZ1_9HYPH|nr:Lrp/AsnC family transcriptional regulator [Hoeflea prorocentri]MCY6381282.1 Lrp/AsnC family transcriptional regulator [Hoeflea prorocentri]MDA5399082.1 Lrp/AsnC family transcriptional regulator [Hoeflea prorocentri]
MDDTDRKLLQILTKDGRRSISDLAVDLKISRATVQNRIARMKDSGVISRFTIDLSPDEEERVISAFCLLKLIANDTRPTTAKLKRIEGTGDIHSLSGSFDMIVEIRTHSLKKLDEILDDIRRVPDVAETVSSLRLAKVN